MTTNFMLQLAKALEQCPKCHKITLDNNSRLDVSSNKIVRTCQCGYSIEISIKESLNSKLINYANVKFKIKIKPND